MKLSFTRLRHAFRVRALRIRGGTSAAELAWLEHVAKTVRTGCIVEIGAYQGRSTAALAIGVRDGFRAELYSIEPHDRFDGVLGGQFGPSDRTAFFRNMLRLRLSEHVHLVNLTSAVVAAGWDKPVGLLWVDGDHRVDAVRQDVASWLPHLEAEGILIFDDSEVEGPATAIRKLVASGWAVIDRTGKTTSLVRNEARVSVMRRLAGEGRS